MANATRTVRTSLVAEVSGYLSGLQQAQRATRELGSETERLGQRREAIEGVGKAAFGIGAVAAAGVALAVAAYAEFDQAMSSVQAATHASTAEMQELRAAAIDAGATTVYTAKEAAQGIEELAKAGVSTKEILGGGLMGALDLASAGELEVADAAQIAATAMTQFNLKGSQVPHVADLLAAGAGKAQGSVEDLAGALNQGGLVASQAGFSIEETTGTLAAFASAGLLGSDAGTSLKTAIIALQSPSTAAAKAMEQYGIDVYDSSGHMLSFGGIAEVLQDRFAGVSDEARNAALATIFGTDAVRSANVLYKEGAEGIAEWTGKVNDQGFAAETARLKLDNLKGDVEKLGGAFDTALIQSGSAANGSLRELVQGVTFLVDGINGLPQPVLGAALAAGVLTAAVGLTGGAALIAVPKYAALRAQLATAGISFGTAARSAIAYGGALGVATIAVGTIIQNQADIATSASTITETLDKSTGAVTKYTRAAVAKKLADDDAFSGAKDAGISQKQLTDAVIAGGDALAEVKRKLDAHNNVGTFLAGGAIDASVARQSVTNLGTAVDKAKDGFKDQRKANRESGDTAQSAAEQYETEAAKVSDLATELSGLVEEFDKVNGVNQDAISANAAYQEALAGLQAQVEQQKESTEGYSTTLDENTAVGAGNASMLADLASKAQEAAGKQYAVDQSTMSAEAAASKYAGTLADQRQAFIDSATAAGFNSGEVRKLADRIFQMPSKKQIDILANTKPAQVDLDAFFTRNNGRVLSVRQQLVTEAIEAGASPGAAKSAYRAAGGPVYGPGTATSDSIDAKLSDGEFVVKAASVEKYGLSFMHAVNSGVYQAHRFAAGGAVRYEPSTYIPTPQQIAYAPTAQATAPSPAAVSNRPQVVQNIYPQPMQSEAEIARLAMAEWAWNARRG
ncbi:phage tail tape measure protein [Curtobacterium sp. MCPF17_050]|uniref:phage tail tape measure protein n=1 Tax=Curtobacterium sp. MCPF17_050 TaxID=2175664 RepID=UPI000D9D0196|nr:phage tail tape measure protein [Curtobacterium sp. MCPF17_050]WIB16668.1 phage tail tape measure protein [Curtobacterium sp. MCPF17_050]